MPTNRIAGYLPPPTSTALVPGSGFQQSFGGSGPFKGSPFKTSYKAGKSAIKGPGLLGVGLDIAFNTVGYRMNGDSLGNALVKGAMEGAYFAVAPGLAMATQVGIPVARAITGGLIRADRAASDRRSMQLRPGTNFTYRDSRAALTMRQAAVQAIQGSKMNARNALGGEASLMHRSYIRK